MQYVISKSGGNSSYALESTGFAGGRIVAAETGDGTVYAPVYFINDYLGSVRAVIAGGEVVYNDYYPFGARWEDSAGAATNNRYLFNGKELQSTGNLGLLDYGFRMYDAKLGWWFNPDPMSQCANPYIYCGNNPVINLDPDGGFFWIVPNIGWSKSGGFSIGISVILGMPGLGSVQAGIGYSFGNNDFSAYIGATAAFNTVYAGYSSNSGFNVGWSAGISPQIGFPVSTNFTSVGVNYNISNDAWSGNVSAWGVSSGGWNFNPSVSVAVLTQRTTNLFKGGGFHSNNYVFNKFVAAENYQGALDYFGFEGTYDPNYKFFKTERGKDAPAVTNTVTGDVYYNSIAFDTNYDDLFAYYTHEMRHVSQVKKGEWKKDYLTKDTHLEVDAFEYNYRNQGLYRKSSNDFLKGINNNRQMTISPVTGDLMTQFNTQWWHFVYRVPRIW